ncbi:MAG TPA: 7-carboxy-7-deazaguanine synthase QueE [Cytophagales bacterium]|nr:7-carboxy-7-deazaguanine synthase QueE [Cytophagales bacterium]
MEAFYTLQGEGYYQGEAAYFLRLAGCDVGCHWCDVKESWDASLHPQLTLEQIYAPIKDIASKIVVVTGGEPLQHNLLPLTTFLKAQGLRTHIETSGAYNPTGYWDWFCLSPKKFKEPTDASVTAADELKMIIYNKTDFEFAENHARRVKSSCKLYLQPEWDKSSLILPQIIEYIKSNPKWNISLQIHKYMNIP